MAPPTLQSSPAHLFWGAENVSIILLEPPPSGQSSERSRYLVAMEHTKVSHAKRQFPPRAWTMVKHQAGEGEDMYILHCIQKYAVNLITTPSYIITYKIHMGVWLLGHVIHSPVPGAVHGLEGIYFFLHFKFEHVLLWNIKIRHAATTCSLVPRREEGGGGKGVPGVYCMRMHVNFQKFLENHISRILV